MDTNDPEYALRSMLAFLEGLGTTATIEERARHGLEFLKRLGFTVISARVLAVALDRSPDGLRRAREGLRLSQKQLANEAGLSVVTVGKAERSGCPVKPVTLDAIVAALLRFGAVETMGEAKSQPETPAA